MLWIYPEKFRKLRSVFLENPLCPIVREVTMSARSRWKYQQTQKQGFKPQIPDISEMEAEIEQAPGSDSVAVSEKKGSVLSFFAAIFRCVWRITASIFAKVRNFQQSYLKSITAEGPKEEAVPLFSQNDNLSQEKEDSLLAQQIESTTRQLTELHQNIVSVPPEKEEEETFDADDFDEAVRKARMKLLTTAAVVFLCIGGFLAYQFVASHWSKKNFAVSEDGNRETINLVPEEDDGIFSPQSVEQLVGQNSPNSELPVTPVTPVIPVIPEKFEPIGYNLNTDEVFSQNDIEEVPDFTSITVPSLDEERFDDTPSDFWQDPFVLEASVEDELASVMDDDESTFTNPIPSTFSLGPSQQASQAPQPLQGEMEGLAITIHNSPVTNLPLPRTPVLAQRTTPAPQFATQFQGSDTVFREPEGVEEESFAPKLVMPNQRYQDNASEPAIQVPTSEPRRQRTLSFGESPTQQQVQTLTVQNENRQYTVKDGDNFINIAQRELGDVTRWREIRRLNREAIGNNTGYLTPGTVISLPE